MIAGPADRSEDWRAYAGDPLPGWCRRGGALFDAPQRRLGDAGPPVDLAICSVSFDTTASTRIGARHGPQAIREASLAYAAQAASRPDRLLRNMRDGALCRIEPPMSLVDFGDLHVFPSDPARQVAATTAEMHLVALNSARQLVLGGEHTLSFPLFAGVARAAAGRNDGAVGYVQIDHHFDFGDRSVLHGPYYHGSNARRIAELPDMGPRRLGFVGAGDFTSAAQYDGLVEQGAAIRGMVDIRRLGIERCLTDVLDSVLRHCTSLYVSLDIDVCDTSAAPGTGHVTVGGLTAAELLAVPAILRRYPVRALDVMEVNPLLDPGGATAHLAARFLFEWLMVAPAS